MTVATVAAPSRHALWLAFAIWSAIVALLLWREVDVLRAGETWATFSYYVRAIRFSAVGRVVLLPLWMWLTMHFILAPRWLGVNPNNWRTVAALALGVAWALAETLGWIGSHS